ncbi:hypothetical protein GUITHDRAFT_146349 [Guillardia theta CCMP2712]|uniref:Uncharacterized protein n=1 Tax=Guillardia theta (strain CCMP2712) TaxID=905079 RepID=L1IHN3_GUITC|nr:hypothetical protein GUITHDRAFT_146349 [Guillardia theta CCMP2712]EKX35612.1 hypothetical protein GUITHDRAFT_146349 [Guillardia theta CCMP2712]|eukprot:XP_005822592.1 hypothetical protein GUITHDRAFT_146349 [Guillardia theta CCMP2712]
MISKGSTQTANSDALYEDAGYYYIPFKAYKNGSTMARAVFNIFLQESRSAKTSEPPSVVIDDLGNVTVVENDGARNLPLSPLNSPSLHANDVFGPKIELSKRSPHDSSRSVRKHESSHSHIEESISDELENYSNHVLESLEYIFGHEAIAKLTANTLPEEGDWHVMSPLENERADSTLEAQSPRSNKSWDAASGRRSSFLEDKQVEPQDEDEDSDIPAPRPASDRISQRKRQQRSMFEILGSQEILASMPTLRATIKSDHGFHP